MIGYHKTTRAQDKGTWRCSYAGPFAKKLQPVCRHQRSAVSRQRFARYHHAAFTLTELLVAVGVLVLLVLLATQLLNSAAIITTLGHKQMDTDSEVRQLLDRMALDFAQMVKRSDVDYFLKASTTATDCSNCGPQAGNDQIIFFSTVPGYFSPDMSSGQRSPISLVSYRVNSASTSPSYNRMERLGRGLAWNGVSLGSPPIMFLPQTILTIMLTTATSDYEVIGPEAFRLEYYYLLRNGSLSSSPWYTATSVRGMQDVAAIVADIAVIDTKSRGLFNNTQITTLAGTLPDYTGQAPGALLSSWRNAIDTNASLPRPAISGIRLYERYFYLSPPTLLTP